MKIDRSAVHLSRIVRDKAHTKGTRCIWNFESRAGNLVIRFKNPFGMGNKRLPFVYKTQQTRVEKQRTRRIANQTRARIGHRGSSRICGKCEKHKPALRRLHARRSDFFLIWKNGFQVANLFTAENPRIFKLCIGLHAGKDECQQTDPDSFM